MYFVELCRSRLAAQKPPLKDDEEGLPVIGYSDRKQSMNAVVWMTDLEVHSKERDRHVLGKNYH